LILCNFIGFVLLDYKTYILILWPAKCRIGDEAPSLKTDHVRALAHIREMMIDKYRAMVELYYQVKIEETGRTPRASATFSGMNLTRCHSELNPRIRDEKRVPKPMSYGMIQLRGLGPQANYTDRAIAACRRS
jgi:hypothetical protein